MLIKIARAILPVFPEKTAFAIARTLAALPTGPSLKDDDRAILDKARRFEFGDNVKRVAWTWGEGPLVGFVHGWGGRAGQLVKMADRIACSGYRVVLFDARAHGESQGHRISFRNILEDVSLLDDILDDEVYAWVCHSAGGLCTLAARLLKGLHAPRYACISTPMASYIPVNEIRQQLKPRAGVIARCKRFYSSDFEMTWEQLHQGSAFVKTGESDLLLIYDRDDPRVDHKDGERIQAVWPDAQVIKTDGLGHLKGLWDPTVIGHVVGFLDAGQQAPGQPQSTHSGSADHQPAPAQVRSS